MSTVEFASDAKRVAITVSANSSGWNAHKNALFFTLDDIEHAQALRDALSAFLAFHQRPGQSGAGTQKPADVE